MKIEIYAIEKLFSFSSSFFRLQLSESKAEKGEFTWKTIGRFHAKSN